MADALNLQNALSVARTIPALTGTVTVVDDAGKVVTTSKNIFSAFKSAREAYKARKAEIASERHGEATQRRLEARRAEPSSSSRREHRSHKLITATEDGAADESQRKKDKKRSKSRKRREADDSGEGSSRSGGGGEMIRRGSADTMQTETTLVTPGAQQAQLAMLHHNASLLTLAPAAMFVGDDPLAQTLQGLLMTLQNTIDEMSCITAGIGALISELQKVPDTLAVVGLTLAEISALVAKISPAAIMGMKSAFPIIFGLLSSPQFAVIAGVGMAATVVVLGGLRIVANMAGVGENADDDEEERDLDLEFGVTQLPDDIEEPEVAAVPQVRRAATEPVPQRAIMPPPTQLENSLNAYSTGAVDDKELRKRMKRRESESAATVKTTRSDKPLKSAGSSERERERERDRDRSHKDRPKLERGESSRRHHEKSGDKSERREKREKSERHDRSDRSDRGDKHDKSDRHERSDKKKKEKELPPLPPAAAAAPSKSKFSLIRRATAPAVPAVAAVAAAEAPQRPSLSKRVTNLSIMSSKTTSSSEEKLKAPKKKLLGGFFDGRS